MNAVIVEGIEPQPAPRHGRPGELRLRLTGAAPMQRLQDLAAVRRLRPRSGARPGTRSPTSSRDLAPEFGVALRFALAGGSVARLRALARRAAALPARATTRSLALQGAFLYGVSYVCVYHAERFVPSGLVAVGYSASPLLAGIGAAVLFGAPVGAPLRRRRRARPGRRRPDLLARDRAAGERRAAATLGVVVHRRRGAALGGRQPGREPQPQPRRAAPAGARATACSTARRGGARRRRRSAAAFALPTAPSWWLSLAWLALAGSVLAFACFLTLQDRSARGRPAPSA